MSYSEKDGQVIAIHLHRCHVHAMAPEERCVGMFECSDDCVEDEQETFGFCAPHEQLAKELEAILNGKSKAISR